MTISYRVYWTGKKGRTVLNFNAPAISPLSVVHISAAEAGARHNNFTDAWYDRFVGAANIWATNVAPHEGGVTFVLNVDWHQPLNVVTDITVSEKPVELVEAPMWGRLANPEFPNTRIKTTLFFSGQARDGSDRYGCPIGNELGNYTAHPVDERHLNWTVNPANQHFALDRMSEAGINVVTMSSWGERFLPCTSGWAGFAPMQTSPISHDELFSASVGKRLLIMPLIESRGDWAFCDEFPRWTDGRIAPGTVSQICELVQSYLKDTMHPEWADRWARVYDRHGVARHAIVIIHASSNRLGSNDHAAFAEGFDLIAEAVFQATGMSVGFLLDALPPNTNAPGSFKPDAPKTGPFLYNTDSILGIQCFIPEVWTGSGNESFLLSWKRNFCREWLDTGIPFLMDVSPGYDAHIVFRNPAPSHGWNQTWRDNLSQLVAEFGRNGMVFNSWNGYTEKMVAVPIRGEDGDVVYQWLQSLN
jgi:hypothetical protein